MNGATQSLKWAVSYSPMAMGVFHHVADEYADTWQEVERMILHDYSDDETPVGFYKLRPEFGGVEYLVEKKFEAFDD